MNVQEVAAVLAYFGSAWPSMDISDDTADVWIAELEDIDPSVAGDAMRYVVRTRDFPPSIAAYRAACQEVAHRRQQNRPMAAIESGPPEEVPRELVAAIREVIKTQANARHWHGGPGPCPVCGGPPPRTPSRRKPRAEIAKTWCSRCGSNSMSYVTSLKPKPVEPMAEHPEQIAKPKKKVEQ